MSWMGQCSRISNEVAAVSAQRVRPLPEFFSGVGLMIIIGIDIGKFRHQAIAIDEQGKSLCPSFAFENTDEGFTFLLKRLSPFQEKDCICVGMEATGHYWLNLYFALLDLGMVVHVINPIQTDAVRRINIRKTKTDSVDCKYVAEVIRIGNFSDYHVQSKEIQQLKQLCRFRYGLVDEMGMLKNRTIGILDIIFPEYSTLFSNVFGVTSLALLKKYTSPEEILKVPTKRLADLLSKNSRGRFGEEKALEIKAACKRSVGLMDNTFAFVYQMRMTIQLIDFMGQQLEDIEKQIEAIYSSCDCYLHTIIGVGITTAAVIYAELGNIDNFDSPKKLVAYAGMDPSRKQSGNYESTHNSMSKRGSTYLRRAVWNAAVVAAQKDPALNAFYLKKRDEGKNYMTTIGGVSHKLLNIVFAIMRDNKPYVPRV